MPQITGWPYNARRPQPRGLLRRIWPTVRIAAGVQFAVVLVGGELLNAARLVSHFSAGVAVFASLGVMILLALVERALLRLRAVDEENPARPPIDVAAIPPPPVPPPLADEAPRPPEKPVAAAQAGGALPARLGGAAWGFEGGYVWKPEGRDEG